MRWMTYGLMQMAKGDGIPSRWHDTIEKRGGAHDHELEDLMISAGAGMNHRPEPLLESFGIEETILMYRPKVGEEFAHGFGAITVPDYARFLINLERLGININADDFMRRQRDLVKKKPLLTQSELAIYWYRKERHTWEEPKVFTEISEPHGMEEYETPHGYRLERRHYRGQSILTVWSPAARKQALRASRND